MCLLFSVMLNEMKHLANKEKIPPEFIISKVEGIEMTNAILNIN